MRAMEKHKITMKNLNDNLAFDVASMLQSIKPLWVDHYKLQVILQSPICFLQVPRATYFMDEGVRLSAQTSADHVEPT